MRRPPQPRKTANLSGSIHQQLNMYAIAAGAASVGMLALAQPSEAKIVYTRANMSIQPGHPLSLDLNHDGIADFGLCILDDFYSCIAPPSRPPCGAGHSSLLAIPAKAESQQNQIYATSQGWAAAVPAGFHIGPKRKFSPGDHNMFTYTSCPPYGSHGPWANVTRRYLGLKFIIKGKVHYGWARLNHAKGSFATLTGYAYETIPNEAIIAGATKESDDGEPTASLNPQTPEPATLGVLALGAPSPAIWRREESVIAAPKPY